MIAKILEYSNNGNHICNYVHNIEFHIRHIHAVKFITNFSSKIAPTCNEKDKFQICII